WNPPIIAHDLAHFFYALDEYKAYYDKGHRANELTGYLCVDNHNLDGDSSSTMDEHCLMRGSFWAVMDYLVDHFWSFVTFGGFQWDYNICSSTLAQLAATPTADNKTAPTDVPPAISANVVRSGSDLLLQGQAGSAALGNKNPYNGTAHPNGERHDVSADPIVKVTLTCACQSQDLPVPGGSARLVDLTHTFPNVPSGE